MDKPELLGIRILSCEYEDITSFFYYEKSWISDFIYSNRDASAKAIIQWLSNDQKRILKLCSKDSILECHHFLAETIYRKLQDNQRDYFGNKTIFLPTNCPVFNISHIKKDNVIVASESQVKLLSNFQKNTSCRIIILMNKNINLLPNEEKIELSELDIDITKEYLLKLNHPEEDIDNLLQNLSYKNIREKTLG